MIAIIPPATNLAAQPQVANLLPHSVCLASQSPRRKALLESMHITVHVLKPLNDQHATTLEAMETPRPNESPAEYVRRVCMLKLHAATDTLANNPQATWPNKIVLLTADTTVALGNTIYGKPQSPSEAEHMLNALAQNTHCVYTAVAACLLQRTVNQTFRIQAEPASAMQVSKVHFADIPKSFMDAYIASGEPFDKAGGYGIQGPIAQFIDHIEGSYTGIMGLPLYETRQLLCTFHTPSC